MGNDVKSSCPVCGFVDIPSQAANCPQCNSDLTCFEVLEGMSGENIPETAERGKRINRFFYLLSVVLLMISFFLFYRLNRLEETIEEIQTDISYSIKEVASEIGLLKTETADITVSLEAIEKDNTVDEFIIYNAKKADTLWEISEKFYKKGMYYPVLIEHNPSIDIYSIGDGIRLNILKERDRVSDIYIQITYNRWPSTYMRYKISEGETVKSIARKFYKTENEDSIIMKLNPGLTLTPGNRINILLN